MHGFMLGLDRPGASFCGMRGEIARKCVHLVTGRLSQPRSLCVAMLRKCVACVIITNYGAVCSHRRELCEHAVRNCSPSLICTHAASTAPPMHHCSLNRFVAGNGALAHSTSLVLPCRSAMSGKLAIEFVTVVAPSIISSYSLNWPHFLHL